MYFTTTTIAKRALTYRNLVGIDDVYIETRLELFGYEDFFGS